MRGLRADGFRDIRRGEAGTLVFWVMQRALMNLTTLIAGGDPVNAPLAAAQVLSQCGQVLSVLMVINGINAVSDASAEFVRAKRCYLIRLVASALSLILNAALTLMLSRAANAAWLSGTEIAVIGMVIGVELGGVVMTNWLAARRLLRGISQVGVECGVDGARLGEIDVTRRMFLACCALLAACALPTMALFSLTNWVPWWRERFHGLNVAWLLAALLIGFSMLVVDFLAQIRLIDHCRRAYRVVDELSR